MPALEAIAFDMYGTLVDPLGIWRRLEGYVGDRGSRVAEVWRQKQLELTWRVTVMERYEDFEQVTRKALDYALAVASQALRAEDKDVLIRQYNELERFPDVLPGLQRLRDAGHPLAVFSNGTPAMLDAVVASSGLRAYFGEIVSVDEVKAYNTGTSRGVWAVPSKTSTSSLPIPSTWSAPRPSGCERPGLPGRAACSIPSARPRTSPWAR
jgi:2-haloacid dehalogenase